ncbi:MAG: respiratory nitrate reductase subunit gamma [Burkholderiales bacterium]
MTMASVVFALMFYLAALVFVGGLLTRMVDYAHTPAPLKIPTTPAPTTRRGVVFRMAREVVLFESLFKANLWIWALGILFHFGLVLVILRHLRYFIEPVWFWVAVMQPFGIYGGIAMVLGLAGLWGRRILVQRIRYISTPSDHLMLVLLLGIGLSGLAMQYVAHPDVIAVKRFFLGWMRFNLQPLPESPLLYVHLSLIVVLLIIFPFSKLLHAPGVFFSPTRNQVDNPREARHLSGWAAPLDTERPHG